MNARGASPGRVRSRPTITRSVASLLLAAGLTACDQTITEPAHSAPVAMASSSAGSIRLTPADLDLAIGETATLSAEVINGAGRVVPRQPVEFVSSDPAVATVSAAGVITALSAGTATITARAPGREGSAVVTVVQPVLPTTISLDAVAGCPIACFAQATVRLTNPEGPLAGRLVTVTFGGEEAAGTTGADGSITLGFYSVYFGLVTASFAGTPDQAAVSTSCTVPDGFHLRTCNATATSP
jgi:hypothetical protein